MKPSEIALLPSVVVLIAAIVAYEAGVEIPAVLPYRWHKVLHLAGAVMVLGNIAVTGLWMTLALFRDARIREFAAEATSWADAAFSGPGGVLILVNGLVMADVMGGVDAQRWISLGSRSARSCGSSCWSRSSAA